MLATNQDADWFMMNACHREEFTNNDHLEDPEDITFHVQVILSALFSSPLSLDCE